MKNTFKEFLKTYPNEDACLDKLFQIKYSKLKACPKCGVVDAKFSRVKGRRSYWCEECNYQLYPTVGTVFEKTTTPLIYWFYAIYQMTVTRNGVSAKELQRATGVTYKTAWRMANHIRLLMGQPSIRKKEMFDGIVEVDETFVGGKVTKESKLKMKDKIPVMAIVQRNGKAVAYQIPDTKSYVLLHNVTHTVKPDTKVMTDEYNAYKNLEKLGYKHGFVKHSMKQFGKGEIHTNTVEGFFSILKRTIEGTYIYVSPKYLQHYVDEVTFRYNYRNQQDEMFDTILKRA